MAALLWTTSVISGFGIGGGTLKYTSQGFFPRSRNLQPVRPKVWGGVMYFRDPSPSHLRYPDDSYKTRSEEKQKDETTRWDW